MGVLNQSLFTIIVLMAVVTTLCMPSLLKWALSHVSVREEERVRLKAEAAEEKDLLPKIERVLVGFNKSEEDHFIARLAGWLIGARQIIATVIEPVRIQHIGPKTEIRSPSDVLIEATRSALQSLQTHKNANLSKTETETKPSDSAAGIANAKEISTKKLVSILNPKEHVSLEKDGFAEFILEEARNGYGMIFLRLDSRSISTDVRSPIEKIIRDFAGPAAILFGSNVLKADANMTLTKILVPTSGADYSRFGAEVAVAIAKGCGASITAVHISVSSDNELLRLPVKLMRTGRPLVDDIVALGEREGVKVYPKALTSEVKESAILRQAEVGGHQLIVIGTKSQSTDQLHFGSSAMALIENASCPVLIVRS